jgi:protein-S-isoprenylcysteine O-methyltransferase Ste14
MRIFWIIFGIGAHTLFALTVCRLFPFLLGGSRGLLAAWAGPLPFRAGLDALLAVQFAAVHSLFLLPQTRERLKRYIPSPQYGCFFCVVTCVSLLLTIEAWHPSDLAVWRLHGTGRTLMTAAFLLTCVALFYSLSLSGLGYQTGWTPWWAWIRGRPVRRSWTEPGGAYRVFRHPIYLSFLGLVWLTPTMTLDRVVLTATWTVYIFIGSYLKDRRLVHYVGEPYRHYQARIPGYPFVRWGPLGRVPIAEVETGPLRQAA